MPLTKATLTNTANTFSENQTFSGTNNTANNQIVDAAGSLMTRNSSAFAQVIGIPIAGAYTGRVYSGNTSTHGMGQGNIRVHNMALPACTIDRVGVHISTAVASALVRLGVYNTDSNYYPTSLIVDFGTVSAATTGFKEITINQAFSAGVYSFALFVDTATSSVSYTGLPGGARNPFFKNTGNGISGGDGDTYLSGGNSSGSLPSTFPTSISPGTGMPYFSLRFS